MEQRVNGLEMERTWWSWWYDNWGKWLQNNVLRLIDTMGTISNAWVRGRAGQERHRERQHQPTMEVTSDGAVDMSTRASSS